LPEKFRILLIQNSIKSMKLRYAIIGCGRISPNHIAAAIENNLEIIAICDINELQMDHITSMV